MKMLQILLVAGILSGAVASRAADVEARQPPINGIAVVVNNSIITEWDVQSLIHEAVRALQNQFATQPNTPEVRQAFNQRLTRLEHDGVEQLIDRQLVLSEFKKKGYKLPESIVNEEVDRRIRDKFHDRTEFIKTLKGEGTTFEAFRNSVRDELIFTAMRYRNVSQNLIISPAKIEEYYKAHQDDYQVGDQVKLRMIVLNRTSQNDANTTGKRAEEILTKINEGADFGEMAQVNSDGSQRAQGGEWGWKERSFWRKAIADVAFSLQPGQHSGVVETPDAYYIILVEDRRPAHVKPLSEVRDEIEKILLGQEQSQLLTAWFEKLKNKAFIRYIPD